MLRSESMRLYQLLIPRESSYDVMNELGQIDSVMIVDQQKDSLAKPFNKYVQRCDEQLHRVEFLVKQLMDIGLSQDPVHDFQLILQEFDGILQHKQIQRNTFLNEIEDHINQKYQSVLDQNEKIVQLTAKRATLSEFQKAMVSARKWLGNFYFMSKSSHSLDFDESKDRNYSGGMIPNQKMTHFVGLIEARDFTSFSKTIFRITKGNFMIQNETLEQINPKLPNQTITGRVCFLLIFPCSSLQSYTWRKIKRLCESFQVDHVSLPNSEELWDTKYSQYDKEMEEISHLIDLTTQLLKTVLAPLAEAQNQFSLRMVRFYLIREKCLYMNLNKVVIQDSALIATIWVKYSEIQLLLDIINKLKIKFPNVPAPQLKQMITNDTPPTFFRSNQFNKLFHIIVETYGIPRYKEINPAIFTIVTFPFMFGVMFGDLGHGSAILLFGLYLSITKQFSPRAIQKQQRKQRIASGKQQQSQINTNSHNDEDLNETSGLQIIYDLRYMLLLCGSFSIYCGLIYNEYFGFNLNIFGSCQGIDDCTYPFGFDPDVAHDLNFTNSVKMKLAIIIGFMQMSLGLICFGLNSLYFKDYVSLLISFPCKVLFFVLTIGYMVYLIIAKWLTSWPNNAVAPSVISTMVDMWMHQGKVVLPMADDIPAQEESQLQIVVVALICIPFILFMPMLRDINNKYKHKYPKNNVNTEHEFELVAQNQEQLDQQPQQVQHHDEGYGDIVVHHIIETIEFVLGCISNTASYLRLWALSLAHSQLASVFYQLTLASSVEEGNAAGLIFGLPAFVLTTFGVLLCMDTMECFLHALRLHWVEFQNKFFKGDGYLFDGYSFIKEMQQYQDKCKY